MQNIVERLQKVEQRINQALEPMLLTHKHDLPALIAVSKTYQEDSIIPLLNHGHRAFGENRVQEAQGKWPSLKEEYNDIELHLIGPLQTNKVKDVVELFDVIETVDRPKLAKALAKEFTKTDNKIDCFVQVNTGEEEQKAGVLPNQVDEFIDYCINELGLPIVGLMCIPPANEDTTMHFALLKKIAKRNGLERLSMGMSGDFELATAMGATDVRVGSAIFGARN